MLSRETEERVRQHLRLAKGLLETTVLKPESTEFEERNSLSRTYYSLFHAICALLLSHEMEPSKSHGGLRKQVRKWSGSYFAQFLSEIYELRRFADYDPGWIPVRHVNHAKLKIARSSVVQACDGAEKKLRKV